MVSVLKGKLMTWIKIFESQENKDLTYTKNYIKFIICQELEHLRYDFEGYYTK